VYVSYIPRSAREQFQNVKTFTGDAHRLAWRPNLLSQLMEKNLISSKAVAKNFLK